MPIYEFQCTKCEGITEAYLPKSVDNIVCSKLSADNPNGVCLGEAIKVFSAPAIVYQRKYQLNGKEWG